MHELYPVRTCKLPLSNENIKANKFKVCLQYHIHKCKGPCEGSIAREGREEVAEPERGRYAVDRSRHARRWRLDSATRRRRDD